MTTARMKRVVATRKLCVIAKQGRPVIVDVQLGVPTKLPDSSNFLCTYRIVGIGAEKIRYAIGVDGIQALELAIEAIEATLVNSREAKDGNLRWIEDNGEPGEPYARR